MFSRTFIVKPSRKPEGSLTLSATVTSEVCVNLGEEQSITQSPSTHELQEFVKNTMTKKAPGSARKPTKEAQLNREGVEIVTKNLPRGLGSGPNSLIATSVREVISEVLKEDQADHPHQHIADRDLYTIGYGDPIDSGPSAISYKELVGAKHSTNLSFSTLHPQSATTVYQNPWLGKIIVRRKTTRTKSWNTETGTFDIKYKEQQTTVELRVSSWLSQTGMEFHLQKLHFKAPEVLFQPVSYVNIPAELSLALDKGDLITIQKFLSQGMLRLTDREDVGEGSNLLEKTLHALTNDWYWTEASNKYSDDPPEEQGRDHYVGLIETSRWLISQGLTCEMQYTHRFLNEGVFVGLSDKIGDLGTNIYNMERLLIDSTTNAPAISRANLLLDFAIQNPDHSLYLESVISDIISEAGMLDDQEWEQQVTALETSEVRGARWVEDPFSVGCQCVLTSSWLRLNRLSGSAESISTERFRLMKGIRRILFAAMQQFGIRYSHTSDIFGLGNILKICLLCSPDVLGDGFGDLLYAVACQRSTLGIWHGALKKANHPVAGFAARHQATHAHKHGQIHTILSEAPISASDPHSCTPVASNSDPTPEKNVKKSEAETESAREHIESNSPNPSCSPEICSILEEFSKIHLKCDGINFKVVGGSGSKPESEGLDNLDEVVEYYTHEDIFQDVLDPDEQPPKACKIEGSSMLSQLVTTSTLVLGSIL